MDKNNDNTQHKDALQPGVKLAGKQYEYTIRKVLGRGSFGITYQADVRLEGPLGAITTKVAIKEFYMGDINGRNGSQVTSGNKDGMVSDYRRKFIREAQNLGDVSHENIINVMEVFEANGTVYYSMQYIEGGSLDDRIGRMGRLPEYEVLTDAVKISNALKALHSRGMVHLDLKPSNIMLTDDLNPVLIDFGIAKHFDDKGEPESSTKIGAGTPGYSPVEQASYRKGRGIPVTMDIYALGATMYKMLTGKRPPEASVILNGIADIASDMKQSGVSDVLSAIVVKAMSPLIRERYQNMDEVLAVLEEARSSVPATRVAEEKVQKSEEKVSGSRPTDQQSVMSDNCSGDVRRVNSSAAQVEDTAVIAAASPAVEVHDHEIPPVVPVQADGSGNKKKLFAIVGGVAALVAIAVCLIVFLPGGNKEQKKDSPIVEEKSGTVTDTIADMAYSTPQGECTYSGEVNGRSVPEGKGVATFSRKTDGTIHPLSYDGDWVNGVMEGQGTYTLSNGDVFVGKWKGGYYDEGRYTIKSDGSYYEGKFRNGEPYEGGGTWYDKSGNKLQ